MKKIAIVGSRYMSEYGKRVIEELMDFLKNKAEVITIKVMGCNSEVIKKCQELTLKYKVFEGKNFEKLNEEVASYADVLVIIEGGKNSGTLLLASKFVEKNKDVYCVPGRITDEGSFATNWLIKEGAIPLVEMEDLTQVLQ
jgi:predicted Rossmann fold nucleotide-binding protein DprA/Smf involved in DNA uptake